MDDRTDDRTDDLVLVEEPAGATPAVLRAAALAAGGARVVCVVPVHDRNRVAVEGDLAALADLGAAAVLVDAQPPAGRVVDLVPIEAVRLARAAGLRVAVRGPVDDPVPWRAAGADLLRDAGTWRPL